MWKRNLSENSFKLFILTFLYIYFITIVCANPKLVLILRLRSLPISTTLTVQFHADFLSLMHFVYAQNSCINLNLTIYIHYARILIIRRLQIELTRFRFFHTVFVHNCSCVFRNWFLLTGATVVSRPDNMLGILAGW